MIQMAKKAIINIRTEEETKKQIESLFSQFGITVSDAVNMFFRQSLIQNGLPFTPQLPVPNAETLAAIDDVNNNRNMIGPFDTIEDLMRELNA